MRLLIKFFVVSLLFAAIAQAEEAPSGIFYNKQKDSFSMKVDKLPLKQVLGTIAIQSHIEVLFDDRADQPITMSFKDRPLQEGLKNLLAGSSYAFRYTKNAQGKELLLGVTVLPLGDNAKTATNAKPLLEQPGEVFIHEKNNRALSIEEQAKQDDYNRRWKARLAEMPPAVREKAEQHAHERLDERDKKNAANKKQAETKKAEREKRKQAHEARRQKMLEGMSAEDRAAAELRRKNADEKVIAH